LNFTETTFSRLQPNLAIPNSLPNANESPSTLYLANAPSHCNCNHDAIDHLPLVSIHEQTTITFIHHQTQPKPHSMKTSFYRNFLISFLLLAGISQSGQTQVLLYDNFDYPAGDSIIWHNWLTQQTNLTNAILVANEGLSYANFPCSGVGNAAAVGTTGQDVFRGFTKQTLPGSYIYMACLAKVTSAATGDAFITLKESATSPTNLNYRGRVYAKIDGSNNLAFGISKGAITAPAVADYTDAIYSLNTTYLLVVKYKIIEGTTNDSAFLFVNPVIGNPEPSPTVEATDITANDVGLGSVLLRQGNTGSSPTVIVDGVRVAKTWQHVLQESDIATLNSINIDGSNVFNFDPQTITYNDTVPAGQTSVAISAIPTDWASTVVITPAASIPGISTILVTSESGSVSKTYYINHAYAYYTVDLAVSPESSGTATGGGVFGEGFSATVNAQSATGFMFANWTKDGTIVSTSSTYTFIVSESQTLVANFVPAVYMITATASPVDGGTISGTGQVNYGSNATLTATPGVGYDFDRWTEGGNLLGTNPVLVLSNVTANHDVVAHFLLQTMNINITANPAEGGTVSNSTSVSYGSTITISAFPNSGWIFESWTEDGNVLGTEPTLILANITTDRDITGNFVESVLTFTVTATANPAQGGTITGTGNVALGGSITLTAIPNPDYIFLEWTEDGNIIGTNPEITLTNVTANHNLVANFQLVDGTDPMESTAVSVYPTYSSGVFHVKAPVEIREICVFNLLGENILEITPIADYARLNLENSGRGTYILRIVTISGTSIRKIYCH